MLVAAKSVHVEFVSAGTYMHIDAGSVQSLELLRPLQPGGAAAKKASTLLGRVPPTLYSYFDIILAGCQHWHALLPLSSFS